MRELRSAGDLDLDSQVSAYTGASELAAALKDVDLVIIPAGVPRKPGMTRDDLFNINAGIVRTLIEGVADHCPNVRFLRAYSDAMICIIGRGPGCMGPF